VTDDNQRYWGQCRVAKNSDPSDENAFFETQQAVQTVQNLVQPALLGAPLARFREVVARLDDLIETITVSRPAPPDPTPTEAVSRRQLLTGQLTPENGDKPVRMEQVQVQRPLPAALQWGLSQALLAAVAASKRLTITELLCDEFNMPHPESPVPLHIEVTDDNIAIAAPILSHQVASLGYTTSATNHQSTLGVNAEKLQRLVRQVRQWLSTAVPDQQPTIHLNVQGGLGVLFDNNEGKILGALYGLEHTAKPYPVAVQNAAIVNDRSSQIKILHRIKSYFRIRQMKIRLVADAWINSLEDVHAFLEAEAAHAIYLEAPRLGGIHHTLDAIQACRKKNVPVILSGNGRFHTTIAQITLAARPSLVSGPPAPLHNEMSRILAGLTSRN